MDGAVAGDQLGYAVYTDVQRPWWPDQGAAASACENAVRASYGALRATTAASDWCERASSEASTAKRRFAGNILGSSALDAVTARRKFELDHRQSRTIKLPAATLGDWWTGRLKKDVEECAVPKTF